MGDEDQKKMIRSNALAHFTRKCNDFDTLLATAHSTDLLAKAYTKVDECYDKLEEAQDAYILVATIDVDVYAGGVKYLENAGKRHGEGLANYST